MKIKKAKTNCACVSVRSSMGQVYGMAVVSIVLVPAVCAGIYSIAHFIRCLRLRSLHASRRAVGAMVVVELPHIEMIIIQQRRASVCAICMDGTADSAVSPLCPHRTCAECLGKIGSRCPFCRADRS